MLLNCFKKKIKCNSEQLSDVLKDCKNQKRKKLDNEEKRKKTLSQNLDDVKYKCTLVFQKIVLLTHAMLNKCSNYTVYCTLLAVC